MKIRLSLSIASLLGLGAVAAGCGAVDDEAARAIDTPLSQKQKAKSKEALSKVLQNHGLLNTEGTHMPPAGSICERNCATTRDGGR